ncbi:MAG: hypothetical protein MUO82_12045, partial [Candidatus Thermoplasmatota archaeon]|nr:hypothetical protein [Candidatus Thermoplasmatota archaeon]
KIRCSMATYDGTTEIKIMPLLNPRYNSDKCKIWRKFPSNCFYKLANTKKTAVICKICIPYLLNRYLLENIQANVLPELRKKGILMEKEELRTPEFRRFTRK